NIPQAVTLRIQTLCCQTVRTRGNRSARVTSILRWLLSSSCENRCGQGHGGAAARPPAAARVGADSASIVRSPDHADGSGAEGELREDQRPVSNRPPTRSTTQALRHDHRVPRHKAQTIEPASAPQAAAQKLLTQN